MSHSEGFNANILAEYASYVRPERRLHQSLLHSYTARTMTLIMQHRKSEIHVIMIPRVGAPPRVPMNLTDLYTWLTSPEVTKAEAEKLLREMREDAEAILPDLQHEFESRCHYPGTFWMGFKVNPSYRYLHLHILSDDLCGPGMTTPQHYLSFHPKPKQFYRLDDVLYWFEIVPERFGDNLTEMKNKRKNPPNRKEEGCAYTCHYKDGIRCPFRTDSFSAMKAHLEAHVDKMAEVFKQRRQAREEGARRLALAQANRQEIAEQTAAQAECDQDSHGDGTDAVGEDHAV